MAAERLVDLSRATDSNSSPLAGATWSFYDKGTLTPRAVFADDTLTTSLGSVVTADAGGQFPSIYFDASYEYRGILRNSAGVEIDDIPLVNNGVFSQLLAEGASLVGVVGGGTVQDYIEGVSANAFALTPDTDLDASGQPVNPVDQAPALQAAIDRAVSIGASRVFVKGKGVVALGSTIEVPFGITIDGLTARAENASEYGQSLRFISMADGEYATNVSDTTVKVGVGGATSASTGFLFFFNVDPADTSTWVRQFPNVGAGGLRNCSIDGTATDGISVAYFAGSHTFENVRCTKVATFAEKPTGIYTDAVKIRNIFGRLRADQTSFFVNLPGNGDAYDIADIHSGYTGDQVGVTKALFIGLCRSGDFKHIVNGISEFRNCTGTVSECHIESGQIIVDAGHMVVKANKLYNGKNLDPPLVIRNSQTASTLQSGTAIVRDNNFIHSLNKVGDGQGWAETEQLDILCEDSRMDITIGKGNRRTITTSGELSRNYIMAPLIGNASGVYADWERHAHWLALCGTNINADKVDVTGVMQPVDGALTLTAATYTPSGGNSIGSTFAAATGTYHYSVDVLADPHRKLGRTGGAVSQAATNGSTTLPVVRLAFGSLRRSGGFIARIYRGTAAGNYTEYADVPLIECRDLIDDGLAVNGFAWKTNPGGTAKVALNNNTQNGILDYRFGLVEGFNITFNGNPTVGAWTAGDRLHIASTADHEGRLCISSGGPGTWVKLGIKGAEKAAAVADLNQTISGTPTQAEVQAISDKIDEILASERTAGLRTI